MRKPLRLLTRGRIAFVDASEVVRDAEDRLFINREAPIYDERGDNTVMVQNIDGCLHALRSDVEKINPSKVGLGDLQTGEYILISELRPFLSKGFDPE